MTFIAEVGSFAGRMRLTSVAWHPDLADPSSPRHQQLAGSLGTELDSLLGRRYSSLAFHTTLAGLAEGIQVQKVPSEANPKVRNHGEGPY